MALWVSPSFSDVLRKNRDVYLNLGFIAAGPLEDIEKLQKLIVDQIQSSDLRIMYCTVSARRLKIIKVKRAGDKE